MKNIWFGQTFHDYIEVRMIRLKSIFHEFGGIVHLWQMLLAMRRSL